MKRYTFQIEAFGFGENEQEAWDDASKALAENLGDYIAVTEVTDVEEE